VVRNVEAWDRDERDQSDVAATPDCQRRDGSSELVVRGRDAVVAMTVLRRRRDEIGEPVPELNR